MAPAVISDDYYQILEVTQTATPDAIVQSYRRLALKLHPDRNSRSNTTAAFQLLAQAYETLKDASKRQTYDRIYPGIKKSHSNGASNSSSTRLSDPSEAEQIAALQKAKQARLAKWQFKKTSFESEIFEQRRVIRRLEQEIRNLNSIASAEAEEEAQKSSWKTWILLPLYKQSEVSEAEKIRRDIKRQERGVEKDMKERRLATKKTTLVQDEHYLRMGQENFDMLDRDTDGKISLLNLTIEKRKAAREKAEVQRKEQERAEKVRKEQQEQAQRDAAEQQRKWWEAYHKRQDEAEERQRQSEQELERRRQHALVGQRQREKAEAEERRYQQEQARTEQHHHTQAHIRRPQTASSCQHHGWWEKVHGRRSCPECGEIWLYLLECPECQKQACPKCQRTLRPGCRHDNPRISRRESYYDGVYDGFY